MQKRRIAVILFCIVSSIFMTSCLKKTLTTATSPIIASVKTVASCVSILFRAIGDKCSHHKHIHRESFCEEHESGEIEDK